MTPLFPPQGSGPETALHAPKALQPAGPMLPLSTAGEADCACCGPPAPPPSSDRERTGYRICPFFEGFGDTPAGAVPRVGTVLNLSDRLGTAAVRVGIRRNDYRVAPGLYCTGAPGPEAPVLVTANYKLTFDALRRELAGTDAWVLVLDTRGVNVWCAAGKKTFSTQEVVRRVRSSRLEALVSHRRLVLPQLAATGVSARLVRQACGFEVVWGPVRARDVRRFLAAGMKAEESMRRVTFTLGERAVLVPVELSFMPKYLLWVLAAGFVASGIGPEIFSFRAAWERGLMVALACLAGVAGGAVALPILLPWLPGTAFAVKGLTTGVAAGGIAALALAGRAGALESLALVLAAMALSSFAAMNFTGSTPYTSPSGVEKEMRRALPLQALAVLAAAVTWVGAAFAG